MNRRHVNIGGPNAEKKSHQTPGCRVLESGKEKTQTPEYLCCPADAKKQKGMPQSWGHDPKKWLRKDKVQCARCEKDHRH